MWRGACPFMCQKRKTPDENEKRGKTTLARTRTHTFNRRAKKAKSSKSIKKTRREKIEQEKKEKYLFAWVWQTQRQIRRGDVHRWRCKRERDELRSVGCEEKMATIFAEGCAYLHFEVVLISWVRGENPETSPLGRPQSQSQPYFIPFPLAPQHLGRQTPHASDSAGGR